MDINYIHYGVQGRAIWCSQRGEQCVIQTASISNLVFFYVQNKSHVLAPYFAIVLVNCYSMIPSVISQEHMTPYGVHRNLNMWMWKSEFLIVEGIRRLDGPSLLCTGISAICLHGLTLTYQFNILLILFVLLYVDASTNLWVIFWI